MRSPAASLLLLGALLCAPPVLAAPDGCTPLPEVGRLEPAAGPYGEGLLWRVERAGTPASHVFGTMHVGDPRITRIPPPVREALAGSRSFVMEAVLDGAALGEFTSYLFGEGEAGLAAQLGEDMFDRTAEILTRYGIPPALAATMKPWAAYVTLSMPPQSPGLPLDMQLMHMARGQGARVYGLESIREQAETLGRLPTEDQLRLLRETVCHYGTLQQDVEQMIEVYLERDLARLQALSAKYQVVPDDLYARVIQRLLYDRNERMAERLAPRLREGGAFVAVGALHLPGERGLLALIERRGYELTRVY